MQSTYLQAGIEGNSHKVGNCRVHSALNVKPTSWKRRYAAFAWIHHSLEERLIEAIVDSVLHGHLWLIYLCSGIYSV